MFRKSTVILLAALALMIAVSGFTAFAQDTDTPDSPPFGMMGRGQGMGMMMQMGPRLAWDDETAPMFSAVAEALGIDTETLISKLQSGTTITELAQEAGIDLDALWSSTHTQMQEQLQALVEDGTLTQAQADAHLSLMQSHWDDMPMFGGQGVGMMGMMRGGMFGNNTARGAMGMGRGR
ncbi:MAG: hypothetical protein U0521_00430 [Anaerolineae bacterium]|mgnify:CR=1 FL=1